MKVIIDDYSLGLMPDEETPEQLLDIKAFFSYEDLSFVFMGGSYDKRRIKKVSFLKKEGDAFISKAAMAYEFFIFCKKNKIKITEFVDKRSKFPHQSKNFTDEEIAEHFPFDYNEHQVRALKKLLKVNTGIIKATTSAGKADMFIAYIKLTKLPTLIVVNKISLAIQLADRIRKSGVQNVGLFHSTSKTKGDVVVSTIGSVKKIPNLDHFKVLIIDEVHRSSANEFQEFLSKTTYPIRLGFSATPEGNDKYKWATIRQYLGSILIEIEAKELLDNKVIAKPLIYMVPVSGVETMDWPSAYMESIVNNRDRNDKIKKICLDNNVPTLILVKIIDHGKILEDMLPNSFFVSGIHSPKERQEAIDKFTSGEIKYLISSNVFNEGISINAIRMLIIASAGKSRVETTQKLGRAIRLDKGKSEVKVYDFDDYGNQFTKRHSIARVSIYKKAGFEIAKLED